MIGGYKYQLRDVDNGYGDTNHSQSQQQQHRDNIRNNITTSSVPTIRGTTSTWTISVTKTLLHHQSQPSGTTSNS